MTQYLIRQTQRTYYIHGHEFEQTLGDRQWRTEEPDGLQFMDSQRIRQESATEQQLCPNICGWCDRVSEERGRKGVVVPNTNKRNSWPFGVHGLVYKLVGKTGKDRRKVSRYKGKLGRLQRLAGPQIPSGMEAPSALSLQDPQWFTEL